jgi:hypothetical protein
MSGLDRDDIIRMARMSADYWANHYDRKSKADMELLRKHVAEKFLEIAAAEREACAKLCLETEPFYGVMFANAIRAGGRDAA